MKKISVCVVGCGAFGARFIPIFKAHPAVSEVSLADPLPQRLSEAAARFGVRRTFESLERALESDVDAVAIMTQRHLHGPMTIAALKAGKHVYCAVPMASELSEIKEICRLVAETGLTYMMGETSYYYPSCIWCRERYRAGDFGQFVYGEGEYLHDMAHGFYDAFQNSGGADWKRVAGVPPMFYPTHSTAMILAVTGARMTQVSCLGWRDRHEDGIFREGNNLWNNPFSNETAICRTSDGGIARLNEFRRIATGVGNSVRQSMFGTQAAFEMQADNNHFWTTHGKESKSLNDLLDCYGFSWNEDTLKTLMNQGGKGTQHDFFSSYAKIHPVERLPKALRELQHNGHYGSHQFLVDDFCKAATFDLLPPVHACEAARYTAPGLIAHASALQEGRPMDVPDFGDDSSGKPRLEAEDAGALCP
jgi:predicted dehydrogenase